MVCVVERGLNSYLFLLVQRPVWFTCRPVGVPIYDSRAQMLPWPWWMSVMDTYLEETVRLKLWNDSWLVVNCQETGSYTHGFSHICLHMSIDWLLLHQSGMLLLVASFCMEGSLINFSDLKFEWDSWKPKVAVCESKEYLLSSHCLVSTRLFSIMWRGKGELVALIGLM